MTEAQAAEHIRIARRAQASWGALPVKQRVRALRRLRAEIADRMDQIVQTISAEVGKPSMDALTGDVMVTLEQLKAYEKLAPKLLRTTKVRKPPLLFRKTRFIEKHEPYGVVLIFAPWNYPLQLSIIPMATALICGNSVVLKCSEFVPQTANLISEICHAAGLPSGVVQVLTTAAEDASTLIDATPDLIFFTGSTHGGRAVIEKAARHLIPVVPELGGKDAAVVFESCDLKRTAAGLCYGSFANTGQVCVGTKRIYVQSSVWANFLTLFAAEVSQLRCGSSVDSDYGPLIIPGVRERLRLQVQEAIHAGATVHTRWSMSGFTGDPVILSGVPQWASLLREDCFGPVVCLDSFDTEEHAIEKANACSFALGATVWTGDQQQAKRVASALDCGSCAVNDAIRHVGNPYASFGGNKASGYGRYRGVEGLQAFSRRKSIMFSSNERRELHWFPFTSKAFHQLGFFLRIRHLSGWRKLYLHRTLGILGLLSVALASTRSFGQVKGGALTVNVGVPANAHGKLGYLLFASYAGFPDNRNHALRHQFVTLAPKRSIQTIAIGLIPPGRYAITVYLDENGNRRLDKSWLGIPKEPAGASNNPHPHIGGPRFDECAFSHGSTQQTIDITLQECCKR